MISTLVEGVSGSLGSDGPVLIEGFSSGQLLLEGGLSSSSVSYILPKGSSNKSHRPEVLDSAKDAAKWPLASILSRAPLVLSVVASCSMN